MQAIVLAGGFGTRLKNVVSNIPKPMAPINDKPFLAILLEDLSRKGFKKIVLAVGYKYEVIVNFFGLKYCNMDIDYVIENTPLGTGGAIVNALSKTSDRYVFVLNGDTYFDIDYSKMSGENDIIIASKYMENNNRYGNLKIEDEYIVEFKEKSIGEAGFINGGIYRVNVEFLRKQDFPKTFSFEKDFLEIFVKQNPIKTYKSKAYFIDIGIPEDYFKFQEDITK